MIPVAIPPAATDIYVDTSVLLAAIMEGAPHHQSALRFCLELQRDQVGGFFSQLLRIELIHAIRAVGTNPALLPESTRRRYRLARWGDDITVRQRWMAEGIARFETMLGAFQQVIEIPLDLVIWTTSVELMCSYHLKSYDATHATTAMTLGIKHLATVDRDFTRISDLNVHLIRDSTTQ